MRKQTAIILLPFIITILISLTVCAETNKNNNMLPHEEYFYNSVYNHENVDLVYDYDIIKSVYYDFEKSIPRIKCVSKGKKGIRISWDKVKTASKYYIYRRVKGGNWTKLAVLNTTHYLDKSIKIKGLEYSYKVRAVKVIKKQVIMSKESEPKKIIIK